jgi:hypothetical protein
MSTEIYKNHYKELYINLLISQLEQMKNHSITIEQFNQVVKNIDKLHRVQIEIIELEDELNIPFWTGKKYID